MRIIDTLNTNILDTIGSTPLVSLNAVFPEIHAEVKLYAKLEGYNPGGSVKDRAALQMIRDAEHSGRLTKEKVIIDSTSGNTGIAYAMIGALKIARNLKHGVIVTVFPDGGDRYLSHEM